jgi:beta-phosphoglucomutase
MQPEALIFDFDGVLADTEPLYWKAWTELLAPHGVEFTWEEYCRYGRGVKDEEMLKALPQLASQPEILRVLQQQLPARQQMVRAWSHQHCPIHDSIIRTLLSLHQFKLGLVTSSARSEVEPLLCRAGINHCFEALVFREDVHRHKPDPAPYLKIRSRLRVETGIAFEDSEAGIQSASAAGFTAIRVAHPIDLPALVLAAIRTR